MLEIDRLRSRSSIAWRSFSGFLQDAELAVENFHVDTIKGEIYRMIIVLRLDLEGVEKNGPSR
jgi:hypothetical protein